MCLWAVGVGIAVLCPRQDYHASMKDVELTPRAIVLGAFFAIVNATANMIFAFRYAGGLAQCVRVRVVFMRWLYWRDSCVHFLILQTTGNLLANPALLPPYGL